MPLSGPPLAGLLSSASNSSFPRKPQILVFVSQLLLDHRLRRVPKKKMSFSLFSLTNIQSKGVSTDTIVLYSQRLLLWSIVLFLLFSSLPLLLLLNHTNIPHDLGLVWLIQRQFQDGQRQSLIPSLRSHFSRRSRHKQWDNKVAGSITFQQHVFDSVPYLIVQLPNCLIAGFLPNFAILFHFLKKSFFWYGFNLKWKKWKVPFLCEIYRKHVRLVARFAVCQHGQHCLDMVSYMHKVSKMNAGNVVI